MSVREFVEMPVSGLVFGSAELLVELLARRRNRREQYEADAA